MGLIKCKECGKNVSNTATSCPNCGVIIKRKSGCGTYLLAAVVLFGFYIIFFTPLGYKIIYGHKEERESYNTRALSDIKWGEINKIYNLRSKQTDLQKNEQWKKYKGKIVKWTGIVSEVSAGITGSSISLQVKMNRDTFTSDLLIRLPKSEQPKAIKLKQGDKVTFQGELHSWGSILPITIINGKIIE